MRVTFETRVHVPVVHGAPVPVDSDRIVAAEQRPQYERASKRVSVDHRTQWQRVVSFSPLQCLPLLCTKIPIEKKST